MLNHRDYLYQIELENIDDTLYKNEGIKADNAKQAKIIVDKQPVQRFWQINDFNGIGKNLTKSYFDTIIN